MGGRSPRGLLACKLAKGVNEHMRVVLWGVKSFKFSKFFVFSRGI